MVSIITVFFILCLIFYKSKISKEFLNPTDIIQTKSIKGRLSILIMLGHIFATKNIMNNGIDLLIVSPGFLYVGMFFFYSGFGLVQGYINKKSYLHNFLYKIFSKIYVPFILMNTIYYIVLKLSIERKEFLIKEFIVDMLGLSLINGIAWYMIVIIYFYFAFYLSFKYFYKIRYIVILICMVLQILICIYINPNAIWWYISIIPFILGVIYSEYKKEIDFCIKKYYLLLLTLLFFLFNFCYFIRFNRVGMLFGIVLHNKEIIILGMLSVIWFVFLVLLILMKIKIENILTLKLGYTSLEIYLYHGLFLKIFMSEIVYIKNQITYIFLCVVSTLILSFLMKKLTNYFGKGIIISRYNNTAL